MGVMQAAGLSLQWFRNNFCKEEIATADLMDVDPYYLMDKAAEKVEPGSNRLLYLPYLMGERAPHLDPDCRGVFFGLSAAHTKRELLRAVMEGVTFGMKDSLEIIKELGVEINEVRASGGGGKSPLWRQMQADIFNTDIYTINSSEGPALGVALLAGVGTGVYKSVPEACEATIKVMTKQSPNSANVGVYNEYYKLYRKLYHSLKDDYKTLSKLS